MGARDYFPQVGRWTTTDRVRFAGRSTNLYLYAQADPGNLVDPDGRCPIDPSSIFKLKLLVDKLGEIDLWDEVLAFLIENGSISLNVEGGTGRVGGSITITYSPQDGFAVTGNPGFGVGLGASLTADLTLGGDAQNPDTIFSGSGGNGVAGAHIDLATGHHDATSLTFGVGWGLGAGGSITTPISLQLPR